MPTVLRPVLTRAIRSIEAQEGVGRILVAIGVDKALGAPDIRDLLGETSGRVDILGFQLPYSTSARHGGVHAAADGGSLRSALSFLANSHYIAYLDDDNEWAPTHLAANLKAIQGRAWSFSARMIVDDATGKNLGVDLWDSVGPGQGRFARLGGFVDPNCLVVDKRQVLAHLHRWSGTLDGQLGLTADRNFFRAISGLPFGEVKDVTVNYRVRPSNILRRFVAENRPPFPSLLPS